MWHSIWYLSSQCSLYIIEVDWLLQLRTPLIWPVVFNLTISGGNRVVRGHGNGGNQRDCGLWIEKWGSFFSADWFNPLLHCAALCRATIQLVKIILINKLQDNSPIFKMSNYKSCVMLNFYRHWLSIHQYTWILYVPFLIYALQTVTQQWVHFWNKYWFYYCGFRFVSFPKVENFLKFTNVRSET